MNRLISIVVLMVVSVSVNAATFNVLSGTFRVVDQNNLPVGETAILTGNGVLVEGIYDGSAAGIATNPNATYAGYETALFLGVPIEFYYAPSGVFDDPGAPLHSAPTIDFNTMTADMTSVFANWNSDPLSGYIGEFNVGGIASVVALGSDRWELSWSHLQTDGPFTGITSEMTMVVSSVPLPAAVWLFGSGLIGLLGIARRK